MNILFINSYPLPVNIEWEFTGPKRLFIIQPKEKILIKDMFTSSRSYTGKVSFEAWDTSSKSIVLMNKRKLFKCSPSFYTDRNQTVILTQGNVSNSILYCTETNC